MKSIFFQKQRSPILEIKLDSKITKRQIPFEPFHKLKVSNDFNAFVVFSDTLEEICIEANSNLHEHIGFSYIDGVLKLKKAKMLRLKGKETLNVFIKTKPFFEFQASDDSTVTVKSLLETEKVFVKITDDSTFIGQLAVENIEIIAKDDSEAKVEGITENLKLRLADDSEFSNYKLGTNNLELHASGDSIAEVTVKNSMNVILTGDSKLKYKGNPIVEQKKVSGGSKFKNI